MQKRNVNLDFIKAVAIIFVIAIHTLAPALSQYTIGSKKFLLISFYRSIVSPAVPLFFMCSGALLFDTKKIISIETIFKKYIKRVILALFFWAIIYEMIQLYYRYTQIGILEMSNIILAIQNIIFFNHNYQLYFVYIMVIVYLFTPIIKIFINNTNINYIRYFLILWLFLGVILPTFAGFRPISNFYNLIQYIVMPMGYASIGYCILGYYITQNTEKTSHYIIVFLLGLISSFLLTVNLCITLQDINITFWGGMSITVAMMAYGFFGMIISTDYSIYHTRLIKNISNSSFTIFLVHDIFLKILFFKNIKVSDFHILIGVPLIVAFVFCSSYITYFILSKIKIINNSII